MIKNKEKWIIGLLCILVISGWSSSAKMKAKLNDIQSDLGRLRREADEIMSSVEKIEQINYKSILSVLNSGYKIREIDVEKGEAQLEFFIELKRKSGNSQAYLVVEELESRERKEILLRSEGTLKFIGDATLGIKKDYQCYVMEKFEDGSEEILEGGDIYIGLENRLYGSRIRISGGSGRSEGCVENDFNIQIDDFGCEEFGLESVILEIILGEQVIKTKDITEELVVGTSEEFYQYREAIIKGEINPGYSFESFISGRGKQDNEDYDGYSSVPKYHYHIEIKGKEASDELGIDYSDIQELEFRITVKCKDGYELTER